MPGGKSNTKLIGSKAEEEFREQLIKSNQLLFGTEKNRKLLDVLTKQCPQMQTAYREKIYIQY
jgi:hypothetical protein